jgi:hypothetical protein
VWSDLVFIVCFSEPALLSVSPADDRTLGAEALMSGGPDTMAETHKKQ